MLGLETVEELWLFSRRLAWRTGWCLSGGVGSPATPLGKYMRNTGMAPLARNGSCLLVWWRAKQRFSLQSCPTEAWENFQHHVGLCVATVRSLLVLPGFSAENKTVCWAESQRCLGPGFSELAFARLTHRTVLLWHPVFPGRSVWIHRPCLSALLSLPCAHLLALTFPFPFCIPTEWLPAPASSVS